MVSPSHPHVLSMCLCRKSFADIDRERLERTFKVNIIAYMSIASKVVKHMAEGSAIINICSIQAFHPMNAILDYATTKVRLLS